MSRFDGAIIERVGRPQFWQVQRWRFVQPARYIFGEDGIGWIIDIPAGFEFDVSWPWWLAPFLPRKRYRLAAGLHDFARRRRDWSLWFSDILFLDALHLQRVVQPLLTLSWWAVQLNNRR